VILELGCPEAQERQELCRRAEGIGEGQAAAERKRRDHLAADLCEDEPAPRGGTAFQRCEPLQRLVVVDAAEAQRHRLVGNLPPWIVACEQASPRHRLLEAPLALVDQLDSEVRVHHRSTSLVTGVRSLTCVTIIPVT